MHKKSFFFSIGVLIAVVGSVFTFSYIRFLNSPKLVSTTSTEPHIYYTMKTITSIDAVGNSLGTESVYRVDGMNGQPIKITDVPAGATGAQWSPSTIQYDVWSSSTTPGKKFHVSLDNTGRTVWGTSANFKGTAFGNVAGQVLLHTQWIYPEGTYATESEAYCIDTPAEGPCGQAFRLIVTNLKTGKQNTYTPELFGGSDVTGYMSVLTDLTPTTAVIQIAGLQDPGTSYIGVVDFSTGKVVRTLYLGTTSSPTFLPYTFIRLSDDRQSLYFAQWFGGSDVQKEIDAMDVQNGKVTAIIKSADLQDYAWPMGSNTVYYKPNDKTLICHDTTTGNDTTIAWTDTVDAYLHPQRFTAKLRTSTSGIDSGKLTVIDTQTGQEQVIYDQARNENAYGRNGNVNGSTDDKNAQVGDQVFTFLGIEQ